MYTVALALVVPWALYARTCTPVLPCARSQYVLEVATPMLVLLPGYSHPYALEQWLLGIPWWCSVLRCPPRVLHQQPC